MDLPRRYAYNPQWRIILFGFAFGAGLIVIKIHWVLSTLGILFVTYALLLALRRLIFPKFLEIKQDALFVPRGFSQTSIQKIAYADIEDTWETGGGSTVTLNLHIKGHTFEINSMMLPNTTSYEAVRDFVKSRVIPKENPARPIEAGKYCFTCSYEGNGEIYNSNGDIIWCVKTLHTRPHYPYGFFRLPDFVVCDKAGKELFRIKVERKFALAQFMMVKNDLPVCTIRQRSIFLNKYTLDFVNGLKWVFRMPLFTVNFRGLSETREKIGVRLWTHNVWYVFIDPNVDSPELVAALAFIHRERLRRN